MPVNWLCYEPVHNCTAEFECNKYTSFTARKLFELMVLIFLVHACFWPVSFAVAVTYKVELDRSACCDGGLAGEMSRESSPKQRIGKFTRYRRRLLLSIPALNLISILVHRACWFGAAIRSYLPVCHVLLFRAFIHE
jgi:hypothetical protein